MSELAIDPVDAVVARVRQVYARWGRGTTPAQMRQDWDSLFADETFEAEVQSVAIAGRPCDWVIAPASSDAVLLYLHGGGFQIGSPASHRELMAGLSAAAGCRVLGLDYRLAPEHRFPAALDDAMTCWDGLLAMGLPAERLAVAGDSSGGGLALSLLLALRDAGREMPAAAVTMSAWTDLGASGPSQASHAATDPINQRALLVAMARAVLGRDTDPRDPRVSPLFAELHGLPPLLMQVGEREIVLSDSQDFAAKARAAGVDVTLEVWPGMVHVFQQFPRELPAAQQARHSIGAFLRRHLPTKGP
jgi:acetyl esterase/lipase